MTLLVFFFATLATADVPLEWIIEVLKGLGVPGAIIAVLGYTARRFFFWVTPLLERIAEAHIDRQKKMVEQQEKLTTASIAIQQENAATLKTLDMKLTQVCRAQCVPPKPGVPPYHDPTGGAKA